MMVGHEGHAGLRARRCGGETKSSERPDAEEGRAPRRMLQNGKRKRLLTPALLLVPVRTVVAILVWHRQRHTLFAIRADELPVQVPCKSSSVRECHRGRSKDQNAATGIDGERRRKGNNVSLGSTQKLRTAPSRTNSLGTAVGGLRYAHSGATHSRSSTLCESAQCSSAMPFSANK